MRVELGCPQTTSYTVPMNLLSCEEDFHLGCLHRLRNIIYIYIYILYYRLLICSCLKISNYHVKYYYDYTFVNGAIGVYHRLTYTMSVINSENYERHNQPIKET